MTSLLTLTSSTGNSFGPSSTQQYALVDPRCIVEHRHRFKRDIFPELLLANSYYSCSRGWPDVGWILLDRNSYNQLSPYSNTHQLTICDFDNSPLAITNLSIVQARCVTRGRELDPDAIYLLQLTNNRGVIYNQWFQFPVYAQYNVRAPGYDGSYYSSSLTGANNTDAWTWTGMIQNLWEKTSLLGTYPGLPYTPDGAPEGFIFAGIPLWEALTGILDLLGMAITGNYPSFTIVKLGADDSAHATRLVTYSSFLKESMEYLDAGSGRVPKEIVVYFRRRNKVYGTEETVRYDSPQWQNTTAYSVTVSAPSELADFASAVGTGYLWSEFTVRYDQDGVPLSEDVTKAQAIATQRVAQYYNRIYRGTIGFMRDVYAGVIPFTTGSLVDGVRWYNTLGCDGWHTEIIRGYTWDETKFDIALKDVY